MGETRGSKDQHITMRRWLLEFLTSNECNLGFRVSLYSFLSSFTAHLLP